MNKISINNIKRPNIIFIVLDTLRADKLFHNRGAINLTPNMNKLLSNSIYFKNCISNCPWTLPSHITMFTGLYHTQTTLLSNNIEKINRRIPVLAEILKDLGYFTMCFSENPFITKTYGLTRGFEIVFKDWTPGPNWFWNWTSKKKDEFSFFTYKLNKLDKFLKERIKSNFFLFFWQKFKGLIEDFFKTLKKTLYWKKILLERPSTLNDIKKFSKIIREHNNNTPFYLFFNIMATHYPYIPPKSTLTYFGINNQDLKHIKNFLLTRNPRKYVIKLNLKPKRLSEKKIAIINRLYDSSVHYSDEIVNYILSKLEKLHLLDNYYVIITSDHGEHLFNKNDHYLWEHNTYISVYNTLMRVPLLIFNPKLKKTIISDQVQLKDLFHTILQLTGIDKEQNKYLDINKSILYQINKKNTPKFIFGEYLKSKEALIDLFSHHRRIINKKHLPKIISNIFFLRSNTHKLITYNDKMEEFFDILSDPYEQNNLTDIQNSNFERMNQFIKNLRYKLSNIEDLKKILTEEEKSAVKDIIRNIKFEGI